MYLAEDRGYQTSCWIWTGGSNENGYGRTKWNGKMAPAHRAMFELAGGVVPAGWQLDHLCRVPACINPDHLEAVTAAENVRRSTIAKLTARDVAAIRQARVDALAANPLTTRGKPRHRVANGVAIRESLAQRYGIRADYVKEIWRGEKWA
jgi:hypothetical protein